MSSAEQPDASVCPRCGAHHEPLQEYCLECGARLPAGQTVVEALAASWRRHLRWYPGDWIWPALVLLVLSILATAVTLAARRARQESAPTLVATRPQVAVGPGTAAAAVTTAAGAAPSTLRPTIATGTLPRAPGAPSTSAPTTASAARRPPPSRAEGLLRWPAGRSGYTNVLASIPLASGRAAAVARARAARRAGLPQVGVLLSSRYASLHPGYYVVFSGVYRSGARASASLAAAHARGFADAYPARVAR